MLYRVTTVIFVFIDQMYFLGHVLCLFFSPSQKNMSIISVSVNGRRKRRKQTLSCPQRNTLNFEVIYTTT